MGRLDGKVALLPGGGTGIGAASATRFRAEGADVLVMGRRPEPLARVGMATGAVPITGDAANAEEAKAAVQAAVERFGGLDIGVGNAGGGGGGTGLDRGDRRGEEGI